MKKILSLIISIIILILAIKLFIYIVPVLIVLGIAIYFYSRYKIKKTIKKYNEENNTGHMFTENRYENTHKEEKNEEFNGTIIDVDYEDIKND